MIITMQETIFDKTITMKEISMPRFIRGMEKMSNERSATKEGLGSFNLVEFNTIDDKKEHNIKSIHGQILDFDGCECSIEEIQSIFKYWTYIIYSSFNNGIKGVGKRFRLVLPYAEPISGFTPAAAKNLYEHIFDVFADDIRHLPSGIDESKRNPGAFYIRPAMTDHPIFIVNNGDLFDWQAFINSPKSAALARRKIEHTERLERERIEQQAQAASSPKREMTAKQKDRAAELSLAKFGYGGQGTGNVQFFRYAKSLAGKGFDIFEIESYLRLNAGLFGNTAERLNEINHIISSIR